MAYSRIAAESERKKRQTSIERRRRMARALQDQGQESVGQMVSGYYVPNYGAALGNILRGAASIYQNVKAGREEKDLKDYETSSEAERQKLRSDLLRQFPQQEAVLPQQEMIDGEVQPITTRDPTEGEFLDWIGQTMEVDPELAAVGKDMYAAAMRERAQERSLDAQEERQRRLLEWQMEKLGIGHENKLDEIAARGDEARRTKGVPTAKLTIDPSKDKGPKLGAKEQQLVQVASRFDEMDSLLAEHGVTANETGGYNLTDESIPGVNMSSNTVQQIPIFGARIDAALNGPDANQIRSAMMSIANQVRNSLFGSALTKTEAEKFEQMMMSGAFKNQEEMMGAFSRLRSSFYKDMQNILSQHNREQLQYMHEGMAPGGAREVIGNITGAQPPAIVPPAAPASPAQPNRPAILTDEQRRKILQQASGFDL